MKLCQKVGCGMWALYRSRCRQNEKIHDHRRAETAQHMHQIELGMDTGREPPKADRPGRPTRQTGLVLCSRSWPYTSRYMICIGKQCQKTWCDGQNVAMLSLDIAKA